MFFFRQHHGGHAKKLNGRRLSANPRFELPLTIERNGWCIASVISSGYKKKYALMFIANHFYMVLQDSDAGFTVVWQRISPLPVSTAIAHDTV